MCVQLGQRFVRKLCFNILMGLQYERLNLKVEGPLELIYSHCLIRLNISSENNDYGFYSFQKSTFQIILYHEANLTLTLSRSMST